MIPVMTPNSIERADNYIKFPDGTIILWDDMKFDAGVEWVTYYYKVKFIKINKVLAFHDYANVPYGHVSVGAGDNTKVNIGCNDLEYGNTLDRSVTILAIGRWK